MRKRKKPATERKSKKKPVEDQLIILNDQLALLVERVDDLKSLQNWLPPLAAGIAAAIVGALFYLGIQQKVKTLATKIKAYNNDITALENKQEAMDGIIVPLDASTNDFITVKFGSNKSTIDRNLLKNGFTMPPSVFNISFPLKLKLVGRKLLIDFSFRDLDLAEVAHMVENRWHVNEGNRYDRNYDSTAFEVIDREKITKLQIEFVDNTTIKIGGVIKHKGNIHFVSDDEVLTSGEQAISKEEIIERSEQIPTLFKYPSNKFLGKRIEPKTSL